MTCERVAPAARSRPISLRPLRNGHRESVEDEERAGEEDDGGNEQQGAAEVGHLRLRSESARSDLPWIAGTAHC